MMRRLTGRSMAMTAMAAAAVIAQPALETDAPTPVPALSVSVALAPFASITAPATATATPVAAYYRLHALIHTKPALPRVTINDQTNRRRRGFGGTMVDYFPLGGDSFHISGGSRFFSRGPARVGRQMTPALTLGYNKLIQGGVSLGIEGGAMLGWFDPLAGTLARAPRLRGAGVSAGAGQLSQIARMTFGYHF